MQPLSAIAGATSKQGRSVAATLLRSGQYRARSPATPPHHKPARWRNWARKSSPPRSPSATMLLGVLPFVAQTAPFS